MFGRYPRSGAYKGNMFPAMVEFIDSREWVLCTVPMYQAETMFSRTHVCVWFWLNTGHPNISMRFGRRKEGMQLLWKLVQGSGAGVTHTHRYCFEGATLLVTGSIQQPLRPDQLPQLLHGEGHWPLHMSHTGRAGGGERRMWVPLWSPGVFLTLVPALASRLPVCWCREISDSSPGPPASSRWLHQHSHRANSF